MAIKISKEQQEQIKKIFVEKALPAIIKALESYQAKQSKK